MVESLSNMSIFSDEGPLYRAAASLITSRGGKAIIDRGRFLLALSGGKTPRKLYELLADSSNLNWSSVEFFLVDERFVGENDPESNYKMINESLLSRIQVPEKNVHPIPTELPSPRKSAEAYRKTLLESMGDPWPGFDMILLGMGTDGHTASLFPESPDLYSSDLVIPTSAPPVYPTTERISITLRAINASREALFLVRGAEKKSAFRSILGGKSSLPAARVRPLRRARWYFTKEVLG